MKRNKKAGRKTDGIASTGDEKASGPFNNAFGGLADLKAQLGGAAEPEPEPAPAPAPAAGPKLGPKVVLQREKKGRGGKTVTRVRGLGLSGEDLEAFAKRMKNGLGCGAVVEDDDVLLQGAQGERAAAWLEKAGVKRVVIGN